MSLRVTDKVPPKIPDLKAARGDAEVQTETTLRSSVRGTLMEKSLLPKGRAGLASADQIVRASADHLLTKVLERKELRGTGVEVYGRGDAELIRRRRWVDLLDRHNPAILDAHGGAWLEEDRRINAMLERSDDPQVGISDDAFNEMRGAAAKSLSGQLGSIAKADQKSAAVIRTAITELERPKINYGALATSLNTALDAVPAHHAKAREDMYGVFSAFLWREMADGIRKAKDFNQTSARDAAELIRTGQKRFVEADPQALSTSVVRHLPDADQRARALADLLLQFRAPEDTTPDKLRRVFAGGDGVESVSELKQNTLHVTGEFGDPVAEREYGLTRAVTLANPRLSSNAVLEARHIVSKIRRMSSGLVFGAGAVPEGQTLAPYPAIHHNFSANTPAVIESFVRNSLFSGGNPEDFCAFVDAMNKARVNGASSQAVLETLTSRPEYKAFQEFRAKAELVKRPLGDQLEAFLVSRAKGQLDSKSLDDPSLTDAERENLKGGGVENVQGQYGTKLTLCAELYRVLCKSLPSAETLKENLFDAGGAERQVADAVRDLSDPKTSTTSLINSLVEARRALRAEFDRAPEGNRRVALWRLDGQLDQVLASTLGKVVDGAGNDADHHRLELTAMRAALISARLSGLDRMRDLHDSMGGQQIEMTAAIDRLGKALQRAPVPDDVYRDAMGVAQEAVDQTVEGFEHFVDPRMADVSVGRLNPNPAFKDDFIKEGPLHYATALGQRARGVGLKSEISETALINPPGALPLTHLGRVVFDRVMYVPDMDAARALNPDVNDLVITPEMDEKKMIRTGGVWSVFPNGQGHAVFYGRGVGMSIISGGDFSLLGKFAERFQGQKVYYDDTNGLTIMPFDEAVKRGLAVEGEESKLKPGTNRHIVYHSWDEGAQAWKEVGTHDVVVQPNRRTHQIDIFRSDALIKGKGDRAMSFAELAELGPDARGLVGEKGMVLSQMYDLARRMAQEPGYDPEAAPQIPEGGAIPTPRCFKILEDAGIRDAWKQPFYDDPIVGRITDENFLQSRFYTDAEYRKGVREHLFELTRTAVRRSLLDANGRPTALGRKLLAELTFPHEIIRSSYGGEDRPFKSGAGQYDSFPNCFTDRKVLEAIADGLASNWDAEPVENNVKEQYNLDHIHPALVAMKQVDADFSGVMQTRDEETGHRGTITFQAVPGFGGGVESKEVSESGKVSKDGLRTERNAGGHDTSLLREGDDRRLRKTGLRLERMFHEQIEPGRAFPVDSEWAVDKRDGKLYIVQARTLAR